MGHIPYGLRGSKYLEKNPHISMKFTFLKWNVTLISFFSFSYNIEDQIQAITNAGEEPLARPAEPCFVCSVVSVGKGILMEQVQSLKTAWGD